MKNSESLFAMPGLLLSVSTFGPRGKSIVKGKNESLAVLKEVREGKQI